MSHQKGEVYQKIGLGADLLATKCRIAFQKMSIAVPTEIRKQPSWIEDTLVQDNQATENNIKILKIMWKNSFPHIPTRKGRIFEESLRKKKHIAFTGDVYSTETRTE